MDGVGVGVPSYRCLPHWWMCNERVLPWWGLCSLPALGSCLKYPQAHGKYFVSFRVTQTWGSLPHQACLIFYLTPSQSQGRQRLCLLLAPGTDPSNPRSPYSRGLTSLSTLIPVRPLPFSPGQATSTSLLPGGWQIRADWFNIILVLNFYPIVTFVVCILLWNNWLPEKGTSKGKKAYSSKKSKLNSNMKKIFPTTCGLLKEKI